MAIHKIIEVLSPIGHKVGKCSNRAVKDAAKSVKNIKSIYVENFQADVKDNKIVQYRVNAKITFEVDS